WEKLTTAKEWELSGWNLNLKSEYRKLLQKILFSVYNSDSRRKIESETQKQGGEKKDKRSNTLEILIDLNEQNHKDNKEFQETLLSMFGQLIFAINQ
ncbi:6071_t:CDS:1, partial [Paraglomus occultum]